MKLSVSLPDADVEFLDTYAESRGIGSRSAVVHEAVRLLQASELAEAYELAWDEWDSSEDGALWAATLGDGLTELSPVTAHEGASGADAAG